MIARTNRIFRLCPGYPLFCALMLPLLLVTHDVVQAAPPGQLTVFDEEKLLRADGSPGPYKVTGRPVHKGSEKVWVEGELQERGRDYHFDYIKGYILFYREISRGGRVLVRFRQSPQILGDSYQLQKREHSGEVTGAQQTPAGKVISPTRRSTARRELPGSQLEIGGAKRIRVDFGDAGNGVLTQSLQVNISGEVAPGVHLVALLSDRNLPLQSSGSTRSVQELDKVLFKVDSRFVAAELGDIEVILDETTFGKYRRRLQGASLAVSGSERDIRMFGAVSQGRWVKHRIVPLEGYQGPYRLAEGASGYGGQIVPGSEQVYLNGSRLRRGEGQGYTVDYERGLLTFTTGHNISTDSRISVEYQYRDEANSRRLFGGRGKIDLADERIRVGATFLREADTASGIPIPSGARPNAAHHQVAVMDAKFAVTNGLSITGELALSSRSQRQGPTLPEEGSRGQAFRLGMDLWPESIRMKGRNLGRIRVLGSYRRVGSDFNGFDRTDRIENEGRWGWQSTLESAEESAGEVTLEYAIRSGAKLDFSYGRRQGELFTSRKEMGVQISEPRLPRILYRFEDISQTGGSLVRNRGEASGKLWHLRPGIKVSTETARGRAVRSALLYYASEQFSQDLPDGIQSQEVTWDLNTRIRRWVSWKSAYSIRRTRVLEAAWQDSVRGWTFRHEAGMSSRGGLSFSADYSRSKVSLPRRRSKDRSTDLARVRVGINRGMLSHQMSYRISSTGAPNRAPTYIFVGFGKGTHTWEDVDGDGQRDPEEFIPDRDGEYERFYGPEGGFTPVREAALMVRTDLVPKRILRSARGGWQSLVSGLTADVSFQADRRIASDARGVAPWNLGSFRSGKEVVSGRRDLKGRLYLNRYKRTLSFRLAGLRRSRIDRTFSSQGIEDQTEASLMVKARPAKQLELEVEYTGGKRTRDGDPIYAYGVRSNEVELRWFWRAKKGWQTGVRSGVGRDKESTRRLEVDFISVRPELTRALPGRGRIRVSAEWAHVQADGQVPLFLALAGGRRVGDNISWRTIADYRLARYLTATVSYDGRKRPGRPVLHLGRMELRAIF